MFVSPADTGTDININVRVQVAESATNATLDSLTKFFMEDHAVQYPAGTMIEEGAVVLSGLPGNYLVYSASEGRVDAQWVSSWTVKDGIPYIITYSATQEFYGIYLPLAENMLASFEIL